MTVKLNTPQFRTDYRAADNIACLIGADEYRDSSFGSLLSFLFRLDIYYLATE